LARRDDRWVLSVGLTGGIACGRTTLCRTFSRLGACVIDLDEVAHRLMAPGGAAVAPVVAAFGEAHRDSQGGIDRAALGALVFADAAARRKLESITHPLILDEAQRVIDAFAAGRREGIAITDAALLVETGGHRRYDRLLVAFCRPEQQLERLMRRDGLSEEEAAARIAAQAPLESKKEVADYLIDTSGSVEDSSRRAEEVYELLKEDLRRLIAGGLPRRTG